MSREKPPKAHEHPLHPVAGILASGVAGQLAAPLRELRESLALMVETLDRYIGHAEGPKPYPWKSLAALRQELGEAYLASRTVARLAGDLHQAVSVAPPDGREAAEHSGAAAAAVEVNTQVEMAIELLREQLDPSIELFIDLGALPPVLARPSELTLTVAKMLLCCADSASAIEGSAISIKTWFDDSGSSASPGDDSRGSHPGSQQSSAVIYVADNGAGAPAAAESARRAIAPIMARLGGSFDAISAPGQGSVYECRLPAQRAVTTAVSPTP
ncbi:MAG: hypothetical protein AAGC55_02790 [Myxococcota bacterium]